MQQCAPNVGQVTMRALIKTESAGNPYILADAGPAYLPWSEREHLVRTIRPQSAAEAAQIVRNLLGQGHKVAIGLTQVEAGNLPKMGLTIEQVLEPCTNMRTGGQILAQFYSRALRQLGANDPQAALQAALSAYWSGDFVRGFKGGYVQKVINNAGLAVELKVPSLAPGSVPPLRSRIHSEPGASPYSVPLQATRYKAGPTIALIDPRHSPLQAPGFKSNIIAQE
jgi:type IV secretion system protein VirB1